MEVTMAFGAAVSNKFQIGTSELRIGPLSLANQLTSVHSVGLLQSAAVKFQQDSVDLEGGFPKTLVDTAIVKTNITVESQAYEYSRKNVRVMLNEGTEATGSVIEATGTLKSAPVITTVAASVFDTDIPTGNIAVGDLLVVYPVGFPENISIIRVTVVAASAIAGNTANAKVTYDGTVTPILTFPVSTGSAVASGSIVYKANNIGLGKSVGTNYFTLDILGTDSQGNPKGFKFWKCAVSGGLDYSFSNDSYAVTPLNFKILKPSAADYAVGGPLGGMANIIPNNPFGMFFAG
jgi:hypothetical protein